MSKKKIALIVSATAIVLAGGTAAWWFMRPTPEKTLYAAIAEDTPYGRIIVQDSTGSKGVQGSFEALVKPDGTYRADGQFSCDATTTLFGDIHLKMTLVQVQNDIFTHFDELNVKNGDDQSTEKQVNDYFKTNFVNRWVQPETQDPDALGFKNDGVLFATGEAISHQYTGKQIVQKLKDNKVITLLNSNATTYGGKAATKYSVVVRKSAYSDFMDSVKPGFKYKDKILDNMFDNATQDVSFIVDKAGGHIVSQTFTTSNPCMDFINAFEPDAASNLPNTITVKSSYKQGDSLPNAVKPASFLTDKDFQKLVSGE